MTQQVDKEHYDFRAYVDIDRWTSHYHQINETLALTPKSVLEIGIGAGIFKIALQTFSSASYHSVDIAKDLHPDVIASAHSLPFADNSFDVVAAFEILEHLPFSKFEPSLSEIARIAKHGAVISLPHSGPPVAFSLKIPFLTRIQKYIKIPFPERHIFDGEHYWEIGKRGTPPSLIRRTLSRHFPVINDFLPFGKFFHHFYVLRCF